MLSSKINEWYLRNKKIIVGFATGLAVVLGLVILAICVFYINKTQNTKHETTRPETTTFEKNVTKREDTQDYGYIAYLSIKTQVETLEVETSSCVGTLIRINFVLTAAHCVSGASTIHIYLGTKNILKSTPHTVDFESRKFIIHENYTEKGFDNDIALIQITKNDSLADNYLIDIASLSSDLELYNPKNSSFVVLGWGTTKGLNDVLLVKNVTVTDDKTCVEFYASEEFKDEYFKIICTKDKIGPCHGDSGAPLILNHIQVGVLSAGDENCSPDKPVRYMNVGYYASWIEGKIAETENNDRLEKYVEEDINNIVTILSNNNDDNDDNDVNVDNDDIDDNNDYDKCAPLHKDL